MLALIAPGNYISSLEGAANVTITTSGTQVNVSTSEVACEGFILIAHLSNTGVVYYGDSAVDAATKLGVPLQPGEKDFIPAKDVKVVWVDSTVSGDKVCYIPLK